MAVPPQAARPASAAARHRYWTARAAKQVTVKHAGRSTPAVAQRTLPSPRTVDALQRPGNRSNFTLPLRAACGGIPVKTCPFNTTAPASSSSNSWLYLLERFDLGVVHVDRELRVIGMNDFARR